MNLGVRSDVRRSGRTGRLVLHRKIIATAYNNILWKERTVKIHSVVVHHQPPHSSHIHIKRVFFRFA